MKRSGEERKFMWLVMARFWFVRGDDQQCWVYLLLWAAQGDL